MLYMPSAAGPNTPPIMTLGMAPPKACTTFVVRFVELKRVSSCVSLQLDLNEGRHFASQANIINRTVRLEISIQTSAHASLSTTASQIPITAALTVPTTSTIVISL